MSSIRVESDAVTDKIFKSFTDTSNTTVPFIEAYLKSFSIISINGFFTVVWFFSLLQCLYQLSRSSFKNKKAEQEVSFEVKNQ